MDNTLKGTLPNMPSAGFSMPDQQTISTPQDYNKIGNTTKVVDSNIKTLQSAQATPQQLASFQKIMSLSSRTAYKERQAQELGNMRNQFDPSKVSGSTFSNIIGGLNDERTKDTQKIYGANMGVYRGVQDEIQKRVKYLQDLQQDKADYMMKYAANKKAGVKKKDLKKAKALYNKTYIEALQLAGKDTAYMDFSAAEIQQSIKSLADQNYAYEQVHGALLKEGIPVFPGSMAADYLGSIFK